MADSDEPVDDFDDEPVDDAGGDKPDDKPADDEVKRLRAEAAKYRVLARDTKAELDRLKKDGMPADERKLEEARQEGERQASERLAMKAVRAEVKALGAKLFEDPTDAIAFLGDLKQFVDDDGEVNERALKAELDDVLKRKPYLAAKGVRKRHGDGDGGDRGSADKPSDMNALIRRKAGVGA